MRCIPAFLLLVATVALAQTTSPRLEIDRPAPEVTVTTLEGEKTLSLAGVRSLGTGKVVVFQFASLTDPVFRAHVAAVEKLAAKEADKALFVIIYQKEAHAADGPDPLELNSDGFNIAEPTSQAERMKLARDMVERLGIKKQTVVVDAWNNATAQRYGGLPNMTFVLDARGNLQAAFPFMDAARVQGAVEALAGGKALTDEQRGSIQRNGPAPFDASTAAMDMTGGRGPAMVATIVDRLKLTDDQRRALLAGIAEYLADVQAFRQVRAALPADAGAGRAGAARGPAARGTQPAPAATSPATTGAAQTKPSTPEDVQKAQATLRTAADKLKTLIRDNVPQKDAAALYDALDTLAPAQKLFTSP